MDAQLPRTALLVRMALPDHVCPWGLRARHLLRSHGYAFEDQLLTSREEVEAFKAANDVKTTPQIWIAGQRIGGHDDRSRHVQQSGGCALTGEYGREGGHALFSLSRKASNRATILFVP